MTRRFRYKLPVQFALLFVAVMMACFAVESLKNGANLASNVIYVLCFIVFGAAIIDSIFTFYHVSEEGLHLKSLLKSTFIKWEDVKEIKKQSGAALVTETIGVYAKGDKISITRWTKGYRELLSLILDHCENRKDVEIDFRVVHIAGKFSR